MRLMDQSDRLLIQRWQRDADGDAFSELVSRHAQMVFAAANRILRNAADAEEVAQDSFAKIGQLRRVRGDSIGGLLHTIATHLAINRLKSESRRREREIAYATSAQSMGDSDWAAIASYVDEAIATLPDKQREAIVRHYLEGQSYRSIAESNRLDESTVRHHAQRGLECIRAYLQRRGITASATALAAGFTADAQTATLPASLLSAFGKQALAGATIAGPAATTVAVGGSVIMFKKAALGIGLILVASAGVTTAYRVSSEKTIENERAQGVASADRVPIVSTTPQSNVPDADESPRLGMDQAPRAIESASLSDEPSTGGGGLADGIALRYDGDKSIDSSTVPEDNAMHHFLLASELFSDLEMSDEDWEAFYQKLYSGASLTDAERAMYERAQAAFELVRQGIAMGNAAMPVGADGPMTELPFLTHWRQIARVLNIESGEMLEYGDYAGALDNYTTMLAFGADIGRGGPVISSLVGIAIANIGGESLVDAMLGGGLTASEYRNVIATVQEVQARTTLAWEALDNERLMIDAWYDAGGQNASVIRTLLDQIDEPEGTEDFVRVAKLQAMTDQELAAHFLDSRDELVRLTAYASLPYYELAPIKEAIESDGDVLSQIMAPSTFGIARAFARLDVQTQGIAAVAALELYRTETGAYPADLDALAPNYLPRVPIDAFTGNALIYRPQADGYRLYSAGEDMIDHGGRLHSPGGTAKGGDFLIRR